MYFLIKKGPCYLGSSFTSLPSIVSIIRSPIAKGIGRSLYFSIYRVISIVLEVQTEVATD